jgi:3-dehydroquinate synthase
MIDASFGGKTGIDIFGVKNLAGTFYPAGLIVMPLTALDSLPEREWKSGMAELIKTAILDSDGLFKSVRNLAGLEKNGRDKNAHRECLKECISMVIAFKGGIVAEDPFETKDKRALLNLGHTFAHALEAAAGLGVLSHGEAVAWGIARSCELGLALGITPPERAGIITDFLVSYGYETKAPHPLVKSSELLAGFMKADKKKANGKLRFIVPGRENAQIISAENNPALEGVGGEALINRILNGE